MVITHTLSIEGKNVDEKLSGYIENITYTDVASGASDTLVVTLSNIGGDWLKSNYPKKGSAVSGAIIVDDSKLPCGEFTVDEIRTNLFPATMELSATASPLSESFKVRRRNKNWEKVTIKEIAKEIADRYDLKLKYSGGKIKIKTVEQSNTDSAFLYNLCESYGLGMKIYKGKIAIYDYILLESEKAVCTLDKSDFIDGTITDGIYGTYTGARISYKSASDDTEISVYVGLQSERKKGSRVLRINETCTSQAEARLKAAAKVNVANRAGTTLSATILPNTKVCAGVCIFLSSDFGRLSDKYFIDRVTWDIGDSTTQRIEAHRVAERVEA